MAASSAAGVARPKLTHFLCLPLVTEFSKLQLKSSLDRFRRDVTGQASVRDGELRGGDSGGLSGRDRGGGVDGGVGEVSERFQQRSKGNGIVENGIPPKAIRPLGSIHLTLGVMSLPTPTDIQRAQEVLQGLDLPELLQNSVAKPTSTSPETITPLKISLASLKSMHPPRKTSFLYANPEDPSGRLLPFCQSVAKAFKEIPKTNGDPLVVIEDRPKLKLHATIVNTVYAKGGRGVGGHGKYRGKITIDAENVLERYKDYVWMRDVRIEKVAICRMGTRKVVDGNGVETGDEEYVVEGEVDMP